MSYIKLIDYIQKLRKDGTASDEDIRQTLLEVGWSAHDITRALAAASNAPGTPSSSAEPQLTAALDSSRLPGVFALLQETWRAYKKHFLFLTSAFALPALIIALQANIPSAETLLPFFVFLSGAPGSSLFIPMGGIMGIILLFGLLGIWGFFSFLHAIAKRDAQISAWAAYRHGIKGLHSFFWVAILSAFIAVGGYIFFIVPGIIFAVWISFAAYVLVAEDTRGMGAVVKSYHYVSGRWWGVMWRILFIQIATMLIVIAGTILLAILLGIIPTAGIVGGIASVVATTVLIVVIVPFSTLYTYLLYEHLKGLKGEGLVAPHTKIKRLFIAAATLALLATIVLLAILLYLAP